jgi:cyanate permease
VIRRTVAEGDPGRTAGATAAVAPTRSRWGVITVAVIAGVVVAFQVGKVASGLPPVSSELGMGVFAASSILAGFNVVAALTGAALGVLAGRVGADRALVLGLLLTAVASAVGGTVSNGPLLFLTTVAEGAGFVAVVVSAPSLIARAARADDARFAFGLWGTYMPGGQAVMFLLAPLLLSALGWRGMWYLNAAVLATCALLAWWVIAPHRTSLAVSNSSAGPRHDLGATIRAPGPRLLMLIFGAYALQFLALAGFLPTVYAAQGIGVFATNVLTSVVVAVNVIGNLAAGFLLRRGAPRWLLIVLASTVMGLAAIGVYSTGAPFTITYLCALAFSAFGGLLPASVLAGVPVVAPHPRLIPATNGLLVQGSGLGMVIGPVAVGALAQAVGGWQATPLVLCTVAACAVVLALRLRRFEASLARRPA